MMKKFLVMLTVLFVGISQAAWAGANIGLKGIGPRIGFVDPDHGDGAVTLGAVADMGTWTENLPWELAFTWWSAGEEEGSYDWSYTDIAIRNSVYYTFEVDKNLFVYPGAGIGVHFLNASVEGPGNYDSDESDTEITLMILGGLQFPITGNWHGQAELQLDFGDAEQTNIQFDFIYELGK